MQIIREEKASTVSDLMSALAKTAPAHRRDEVYLYINGQDTTGEIVIRLVERTLTDGSKVRDIHLEAAQ